MKKFLLFTAIQLVASTAMALPKQSHDVAMLSCRSAPFRQSGTITPHGPKAAVVMGQVGVLMNASTSAIPHITDDDMRGFNTRKFFVVDLVWILRQPFSCQHDRRIRTRCLGLPVRGTGECEKSYRRCQRKSLHSPGSVIE